MIVLDSYKNGKVSLHGANRSHGTDSHLSFIIYYLLFIIFFIFTACSTTDHLEEGEQLYLGISEVAYGHKAQSKQKTKKDSTGVITAMAEAYSVVEDLFSGRLDAKQMHNYVQKNDSLTREQRDSLLREADVLSQATATVREEVDAALAYAPNAAIFGSAYKTWPWPIGLWVYNRYVESPTKFGHWMLSTFGAQPRTVNMANPRLRVQVARQTLRNYGFFQGRAEFEVQTEESDSLKARIAYSIYPGPLFRLGTIEYQNFFGLTDSLVQRTMPKSNLHTGDAFNVLNLNAERSRLSELFRNSGYYYFRPEYIAFRADTIQTPNTVHLQVRPRADMPAQARNRFYMGRTNVTVLPYNANAVTDSVVRHHFSYRWASNDGKKPPIRLGAIIQNLFYERGSLYRQRLHEMIQSKLSGMGVFSNIQMSYVPRDSSDTCDTLDVNIFAILDKPWDSELEAKVTNKSNGLLGPGLSYSVTKRNAFRGAELLNFNIYGSYEWQTGATVVEAASDRSLLNSYEFGASATLTYPRLKFFGLMRKLNRRAEATTNYKLDVNWMNRSSYFQMVNFGGRISYTYQRSRRFKHELTPLRLDYTMLTYRSARFNEILNSNQALYVSMRDQLVPSMGYTLTYTRRWLGGHQRTLILGAKQAGNITNTIYAMAGRGRQERNKHLLGAPYAQFFKLTTEWREIFPMTPRSAIAARAFLGAVWSYGNSTMAPYADLFNVGGANSIRGFAVRSLGPGRYHPANSSWSYVDQVGNLKLEANVEYRFPLVGGLDGAVFLDAGNVWLMRPDSDRPGAAIDASEFFNDIALGTGLGFRYDLDFLVLRFDIGVGIHAPYDTGRSGYYNMRRFWDSLGFHIAVGYPF